MTAKTTRGTLAALSALGSLTWAIAVPTAASATPNATPSATTPSATTALARVTSTFRNVSTGFCLDSNTDKKVYTHDCNGGNFQNWTHS